jgi:hypothetical protein
VEVRHGKAAADHCADCSEVAEGRSGKVDRFERIIRIEGKIDAGLGAKIVEIADKCPVHRTLESTPGIVTRVAAEWANSPGDARKSSWPPLGHSDRCGFIALPPNFRSWPSSTAERRAEHGSSAQVFQMSIFSAISIASSISMPRYRTVLSIFVCPSGHES